jgi:hypothetical protein
MTVMATVVSMVAGLWLADKDGKQERTPVDERFNWRSDSRHITFGGRSLPAGNSSRTFLGTFRFKLMDLWTPPLRMLRAPGILFFYSIGSPAQLSH